MVAGRGGDSDLDTLTGVAAAYAAYLAGEAPDPPDFAGLRDDDEARAQAVCAALAAAWHTGEFGPPPLDQDPIALMLGLVPDPARPLDPSALRRARSRANVTVSQLAARLQARGWNTRTKDVFAWERNGGPVPPAVIAALESELGAHPEALVGKPEPEQVGIAAVTASPRFRAAARRWAALLGLAEADGAVALRQVMTATVRRGGQLEPDQWLDAIETLVQAREDRDDQ